MSQPHPDFESASDAFPVKLEMFEGPLDLLLHLIRKNEVSIHDIPIALITQQYLATIELMQELNLDVAGEFLVMAATLIHSKSKMLLPRPQTASGVEGEEGDRRDALVRRLLEHQKFKAAAGLLHEREQLRAAQWLRPDERVAAIAGDDYEPEIEVDLFSLLTAFQAVVQRAKLRPKVILPPEQIPVEVRIDQLLDTEPREDIQAALAELKRDYERPSGLQLVEVAGGYQIVTRTDLHEWVRRLFHERTTQKLTVQSLETLAVIAYRQPITALEITEIRGVNTSGVLNTLLERHLIKIVGRKQVVGRPFLYATTKEFLIRFGLNDLTDLPKVEDMAEALGLEAPILVERTPGDELLPLEEPD